MIDNFFNEKLIQINVNAKTAEEAIRIAAKPLVEENKIKKEYTENIIKTFNKIGPYFVLLPKVALPHARPEEGAIENAIGITILNKEVKFNSETNDPVKYIFVLSAKNNYEHLDALKMLGELFEDKQFFKFLDKVKSPKEIIQYLKKKEGRN